MKPPPARPDAVIDRAGPADLMQLACDLPGAPMQIAAVLVLGAAPRLAAVRDAIGGRLPGIPRLRQKLVRAPFGGGRPVWVDDPGFDLRRHVGAVACPPPGDENALLRVVAGIVARRLPGDRPLWSATLVTRLPEGRAALVVMLHHVLADGIGGLAVLARLVDGEPTVADAAFPRPAPGRRVLLRDAAGTRIRAVAQLPAGVRRLRAALAALRAELRAEGAGRLPRSSLNRPIGPLRSLAVARADLACVRRAAHAHDATVNDVILTAVTGALRAVLRDRGEETDRFVVSVPVGDLRGPTARHLGNRVGVRPVPVTVTGDPPNRLAAMARTTRDRGALDPWASAALLGPVFRSLARLGVLGWVVGRQRLVTTMVTNLRGPADRLSFLGAPILDVVPVSPIAGNTTVGFAALSYAGTLVLTVIADPRRCPDLPLLRRHLQHELDALSGPGRVRTCSGRPNCRPSESSPPVGRSAP